MAKRTLGVLVVVAAAIAACESNTNSGPSGLPGSSGTSGLPGTSGAPGSSGTVGDGGEPPGVDAGEGGLPPVDAGLDAGHDADAGVVNPTQCTWTASGAQVASGTCTFTVGYGASSNQLGFSLSGTPNSISFGGGITGKTALTPGTYTLADMPQAGATFLSGTALWAMCNNGNCTDGMGNPIPNQGTFTLTITDPGPATMNVLWQKAHGTLEMTLPFDPNTGASGSITFHATF